MTNNGLLNSSTSYGRIVLANDIDMSSVNWTQGIDGSYIYNFYGKFGVTSLGENEKENGSEGFGGEK